MVNDPIIEEMRRHRDAHARRFNYDLDAICADLMARQAQSGRRIVRFPPRRVARAGQTAEVREPDGTGYDSRPD